MLRSKGTYLNIKMKMSKWWYVLAFLLFFFGSLNFYALVFENESGIINLVSTGIAFFTAGLIVGTTSLYNRRFKS